MRNNYIEKERRIIGLMMKQEELCPVVFSELSTDDFELDESKATFKIAKELYNNEIPLIASSFDEYSMKMDLTGEFDQTAGIYTTECLEIGLVPVPYETEQKEIEYLCEKIKKRSVQKKQVNIASQIRQMSQNGYDKDSVKDLFEEGLREQREKLEQGSETNNISEVLPEVVDSMKQKKESDQEFEGISTTLKDLDRKLGGLKDGSLTVIAGRPSMGKSALTTQICFENAYKYNKSTSLFSLEVSSQEVMGKAVCYKAEVPFFRAFNGNVTDEELKKISDCCDVISEVDFFINDDPMASPTEIKAEVERYESYGGYDLVAIDYLQLIESDRGDSRQEEVASISRNLKSIAMEYEIPVIALSQLNRKVEHRSNKVPNLSDLRESGAIEQDADSVVLIYREEYYSGDREGECDLIVAKNRHGPTGSVTVEFEKELLRFSDLVDDSMPY